VLQIRTTKPSEEGTFEQRKGKESIERLKAQQVATKKGEAEESRVHAPQYKEIPNEVQG
jgi:hypothetical protein